MANFTINNFGGQVNSAADSATLYATQTVSATSSPEEMLALLQKLQEDLSKTSDPQLSDLKKELSALDSDLHSPSSSKETLTKHISTLSSLVTIASGAPSILHNLTLFISMLKNFCLK